MVGSAQARPRPVPETPTSTRPPGELVARGTRSTVHAYGRGAVVKVPVPSTADAWIHAEARFAEAARARGAPAPRLLGVERLEGRAVSVWERVEGESAWEAVVARPRRAAELGRLLADVQAQLFALVPCVTLPGQRERLVTKIRRAAASIDPSLAGALEMMPSPAGPPRLCHGDLHPSNLLLAPAGPVLVDWFDAARGDPVADVARSTLTLRTHADHPPEHLPGAEPGTLERMTQAYLARAREHVPIDDDRLRRWQAVSAVARMSEGVPLPPLREVWLRGAAAAYAGTD